jgi:nucleoside-diphosphate-sugar epimerase
MKKIFITGGGGYVGSELASELLKNNYIVTVLDLFLYGEDVLGNHPNLKKIRGDIRNETLLFKCLKNQDAVIHLACISNDPSFELNPHLGKSINLDCFEKIVEISKQLGIKRFIYASSSSVYGIKKEKNVTEEMTLEPLTDYSKFKAICEEILLKYSSSNFITTVVRPATVCGFSKRQRLDLVVNILTNLAFHNKTITIFGGDQLRPNIHIKDMVSSYMKILNADPDKINGEIFNVGYENIKVSEIANKVKNIIGDDIIIEKHVSNDNRSYHISSDKIKNILGFVPEFTLEDAIADLSKAFQNKLIDDPLNNIKYYNIKLMQSINLK